MKNLQKLTLSGFLVALVIVAIFYLGSVSHETPMKNDRPLKVSKINHMISHTAISTVFEKTTDELLRLNIYPIKHTPDVTKSDFDFAIFYSDSYRNLIGEEKEMTAKDFRMMSTNYRSYVEKIKKGNPDVPNGYEVLFSKKQLGKKMNILINVNLIDFSAAIYMDSCRYPPGCKAQAFTMPVVHFTDSCRYPPGCATSGSDR